MGEGLPLQRESIYCWVFFFDFVIPQLACGRLFG